MLLYNIESMARKMKIDCDDLTSHIEHMGVRGTSREEILRKDIKQLLPQKFAVGSGIITDWLGRQSRQQDFFVYDAFNSPVFLEMESLKILPVESVYATIEVKSNLNKETLRQSIENIKSVKALELCTLKNKLFIPRKSNYIFGAVFAYSSETSIETIAKNLKEFSETISYDQQPNMICVLDQGVIIHTPKNGVRQIEIEPSENTTIAMIKNTLEDNLYLFYLILQQHLNMAMNFPPDLLKYAEKSGALNNLQICIPLEMLPKDFSVKLGAANLNGDEIKFLSENHEIIYKNLAGKLTKADLEKRKLSEAELEMIMEKFIILIRRSFGDKTTAKIVEQKDKEQRLIKE